VVDIQFQEDDIILLSAIKLAVQLHASQRRKASIIPGGTPYLSHLMEVAGMVLANGGDSVTCAAAWLHDAIEDQGVQSRSLIQDQCGEEVLALVEECTEPGTGGNTKAPWKDRKEAYLAHLRVADLPVLLIVTADKLQSIRELARKCDQDGREKVLSSFGGGIEGQTWFHRSLVNTIYPRLCAFPQDEPMAIGARTLLGELELFVRILFGTLINK
jgi:(p)ppGpp synthase/HD superfamily hydrolase